MTGYTTADTHAIRVAIGTFGRDVVPMSARIPLDHRCESFIVSGTAVVVDGHCLEDAFSWARHIIREEVFATAEGIADDAYDAHTNRDENWGAVVHEMTSQAVDALTDPCRTLGDTDHVDHVLHGILYNLIRWYDSNLADWHDAGQPDDWDWPLWGERASEMF